MGEAVNRSIQKPLYVYLYGLVFLIYKNAVYFPSFDIATAFCSLVLYFLITYLMVIFFQKVIGPAYAGIPVMITWLSILHVVSLAKGFGFSYSYIPVRFYGILYTAVALIIIGLCYGSRRIASLPMGAFHKTVNVFLLISCIVFLGAGIKRSYEYRIENRTHQQKEKNTLPPATKDIVWILMDEYASSGSLQQQFGSQNELDSFLSKAGFVLLPEMRSRFNNTLFSVNSIFHFDDSIAPSNFYEGIDLLRHNSLVPALERSGYTFINLSFFDINQHPMVANRSEYPYSFEQQLFSGTLFSMIAVKWNNTIRKCDNYNHQVYQSLQNTVSKKTTSPRFIWAHIPIPHQPFCRNSQGQLLADNHTDDEDTTLIKRHYIDYLQYGNSLLKNLLKQYPQMQDKIIVISGDHGPRYPFLRDKSYQLWPYAAVHIPGKFDTSGLKRLSYLSQLPEFLLHSSRGAGS